MVRDSLSFLASCKERVPQCVDMYKTELSAQWPQWDLASSASGLSS